MGKIICGSCLREFICWRMPEYEPQTECEGYISVFEDMEEE